MKWAIEFSDERDFLSAASKMIGAVYSFDEDAIRRINSRNAFSSYGDIKCRKFADLESQDDQG